MMPRSPARIAASIGLFLLMLGLTGAAQAQQAPLFGPAPASGDASSSASDQGPATSANEGGVLHRIEGFIIVTQRNVNREINRRLIAVRDGHGPGVIFAGLLIAFLYGVFHALGPGHGKTVIVGYFLGRGGSIARGVAMAAWIALSHVIGAILIVGVVHVVLSHRLATPVEETLWLRLVSYGAILAIGLVMLAMVLRDRRAIALAGGHGHDHGHDHGHERGHERGHHHGHSHSLRGLREQRLLAVAAGFIPCSGAILILVFAFTNGILLMGMLMALFIAIGMGMTLAALGIASVLAHHQVAARFAGGRSMQVFLSLLGPLIITAIGLLLFSGALLESAGTI
jgi:ABC-type nickel/cobalt efflux system permease component RcnA